jgi:hypothetical protein
MTFDYKIRFTDIYSADRQSQHDAFMALLEATDVPVDWAYEIWDDVVASLSHKNNRVRAISSQLLINLAKSDPENRMLQVFPALINVTRDERFVTARHCLQVLWKVGLEGHEHQSMVLTGLEERFQECISEKNCTLIRYDIIQDLRHLYDQTKDEEIMTITLALIETEEDLKYKKKYSGVWKDIH